VNRMPARRLVHRHVVFAAFESEVSAGNTARPRKENRNAASMRMLAPRVGISRPRNDLERAGAVTEALASGARHNHGAFALRFKRYEFHGDS